MPCLTFFSAVTIAGPWLCCVAPLVLVTLGIGGAWISTLTRLEPLRPVFVVATLGLLALAWRKLHRQPVVCEPGQACVAVQGHLRGRADAVDRPGRLGPAPARQ